MNTTTATIADANGFIPVIWAREALRLLRANIVMARLISKHTDFATAFQGKALTIPYPGIYPVQDKVADTPINATPPTGGGSVTVTLNKFKTVDAVIEDFAQAQANQDLMQAYMQSMIIPLVETVEKDIFALYALFTTVVGVSGTDVSSGLLRTVLKTMTDNKLPQNDRNIVVSSKDQIALLADPTLSNYFAFAKPDGISQGALGNLFGLNTYVSQLVPVVAGAPNSTKCFAFNKEAIIMASAPLPAPPAESGVKSVTVTDDMSGLALRLMYTYDVNNRGVRITLDILYGLQKLRDASGVVVLS